MICPFCQFDIDVETLECPRCNAAYPHPPRPFGFRIRTMLALGLMMTTMSYILVTCVISWLPGGIRSLIPTGSAQLPIQPMPDLKSADVDQLIYNWQSGHQAVPTVQPTIHR